MFPNYHHQIARIRQSEFLQEAKEDQQVERRIRHFLALFGTLGLRAVRRYAQHLLVLSKRALSKHDVENADMQQDTLG